DAERPGCRVEVRSPACLPTLPGRACLGEQLTDLGIGELAGPQRRPELATAIFPCGAAVRPVRCGDDGERDRDPAGGELVTARRARGEQQGALDEQDVAPRIHQRVCSAEL